MKEADQTSQIFKLEEIIRWKDLIIFVLREYCEFVSFNFNISVSNDTALPEPKDSDDATVNDLNPLIALDPTLLELDEFRDLITSLKPTRSLGLKPGVLTFATF
jgi:hypothetical protein